MNSRLFSHPVFRSSLICASISLSGCSLFSTPDEKPISFPGDTEDNAVRLTEQNEGKLRPTFSLGLPAEASQKLKASSAGNKLFSPDEIFTPFIETGYDFAAAPDNRVEKSTDNTVATRIQWFTIDDLNASKALFSGHAEQGVEKSGDRMTALSIHPWDKAHAYRETISQQLSPEDDWPVLVEPDFIYTDLAKLKRQQSGSEAAEQEEPAVTGHSVKQPSKVWSSGPPLWHKGDNFTQLTRARKQVAQQLKGQTPSVTIAHLDTGYSSSDAYSPRNLDEYHSIDFSNGGRCGQFGTYMKARPDKAGHGQRMLSVLAGDNLSYRDPETGQIVKEPIGGDPLSKVVAYRIAKRSVIHLLPKRMTAAIDCAVQQQVDVVSISAGGLPSIAQRNAIHKAYNSGVAVFAATGDFFQIPITGWKILGNTIVFPARYSQVMGVAGITHDGNSYGRSPDWTRMLDWNLLQIPEHVANWSMRGSYGPAYAMQNHVVSGYGPNVTHSLSTRPDQPYFRQNGAGTSSTTPQAAAAASLWLNAMRDQFSEEEWRSWKKTEAVYQAMLQSARKHRNGMSVEEVGEGPVKANDMLSISYKPGPQHPGLEGTLIRRPRSRIGFRWLSDTLLSSDLVTGGARQTWVYVDMLATEAEQIIATSTRLSALYDQVNSCFATETDAKECIAARDRLIDELRDRYGKQYSRTFHAVIENLISKRADT
ncbi:S8/S53 family peptidase [Marinobacterium jannaschii]|uniref:S8/S53 family peptidase n=1 Tax=Marinobacterium jannaschii TaxID=64970 RepID=UPI000489074C|nr:S8/S53 family peptidase [Marinobacterium jannaschii]